MKCTTKLTNIEWGSTNMFQEQIEQLFSKQHRSSLALAELGESVLFNDMVMEGFYHLQDWIQTESDDEEYQQRKQIFFEHYKETDDLISFIQSIYVEVILQKATIPIVSLAAMLSGRLNTDKVTAIHILAEVLVELANIDNYDVFMYKGQLSIKRKYMLSNETQLAIEQLMYLPPMISEPKIVEKNRDNFHYSLKPESLILGEKENHHNGDISLDVLNKLSQQELALDVDYIKANPPTKPTGMDQKDWDMYVTQLDYVYKLINNNVIYMTYKTDKRGRLYSCGHHINPQGDDYHKAAIELANKVNIEVD